MTTSIPDDDVDPEIRAWLTAMAAASQAAGSRPGLGVPERRAIAEIQRKPFRTGGPEMASSETIEIGEHALRLRIHRPTNDPLLPVLVYIHGGGWTLFSIDTHDRLMREYAAAAGIAVVGIDYRLAPEHPYPAALEDIGTTLAWLREHGAHFGLDASRYALGGDSAGANLTLAGSLVERDAGRAMPSALLLNYGAYDQAWHPSYERYGDGARYMLEGPEMDDFWASYLAGQDLDDPLVEPLKADLARMPASWLCIAECDILLDENLAMAERLSAAGTAVETRVYKGVTHSFLEATESSALAMQAIREAAQWLAARVR